MGEIGDLPLTWESTRPCSTSLFSSPLLRSSTVTTTSLQYRRRGSDSKCLYVFVCVCAGTSVQSIASCSVVLVSSVQASVFSFKTPTNAFLFLKRKDYRQRQLCFYLEICSDNTYRVSTNFRLEPTEPSAREVSIFGLWLEGMSRRGAIKKSTWLKPPSETRNSVRAQQKLLTLNL